MSFVPHSIDDKNEIFDSLGIESYDQLFEHIPDELYLKEDIDITFEIHPV